MMLLGILEGIFPFTILKSMYIHLYSALALLPRYRIFVTNDILRI